MKKNTVLSALFAFLAVMTIISCGKDSDVQNDLPVPDLGTESYNYSINHVLNMAEPDQWGSSFNNLSSAANPLTDEGATLGRVLFYDGRLSVNNLISCGSCHQQQFGFADPAPTSRGFETRETDRNSMAIINMGFARRYFWDERASNLEEQVMMPIENHIEMGIENLSDLPVKLEDADYYPELFTAAFGSPEITEERISFALAQFLRSMVSFNSKYDAGEKIDFANFSPQELMGMNLFFDAERTSCTHCHRAPLFGGRSTANIGLEKEYDDNGVGHGHFKVPTLRNIAQTAPYMHDGRFSSLMDVVNHYDHGIQHHQSLDWSLLDFSNGNLTPRRLNLNQTEKEALVAFLRTLTDQEYLSDPKFSNPF